MKFSVPVSFTIVGWLEIEAESIETARVEAARLNEVGVDVEVIHVSDSSSELFVDELAALGGEVAS